MKNYIITVDEEKTGRQFKVLAKGKEGVPKPIVGTSLIVNLNDGKGIKGCVSKVIKTTKKIL